MKIDTIRLTKRVTIGCDPEFVILNENETIIYGENIPIKEPYKEGFGSDGDPFELRPGFSTNTLILMGKIRAILLKAVKLYPYLRDKAWKCGHFIETPLGGHIHIWFPINPCPYSWEDRPCISDTLITHLDNIVGEELSSILDDDLQREERLDCGYGSLSDYRHDRLYKQLPIIEYRTPGSFLISPTVTFLNLTLAKMCGLAYLIGMKEGVHIKVNHINDLVKIMRDHEMYKYHQDVKICLNIIKKGLKKIQVDWDQDFRPAWRIPI